MTSDGKQLESLVSFVEEILIPQGFNVKTNTKVYNDEGIQIAEFDIEVRGKLGTTDLAWLIECRDRPSQGPAPGAWIEQLVGRRSRFGFNKVTAVSTTGFAAGAKEFAESQGIELREVEKLTPDYFADWLVLREITSTTRKTILNHATILINKNENPDRREELKRVISQLAGDVPILRSVKTGEQSPLKNAFLGAVSQAGGLFDDIKPNGSGKKIKLHVNYESDTDYFVINTKLGEIRVESIIFHGELSIEQSFIPLSMTAEYRKSKDGKVISRVASFAPHDILGHEIALEMHKLEDTGETHVIMRVIT